MKKKTPKALFAEYSDKIENGPPTKLDIVLNEALSELENLGDDQLFWKILHAIVDVTNEQIRLAFMTGYKAGASLAVAPNKAVA